MFPLDIKNALMKLGTPKFPIVLAHGLLGFDELHLAGNYLPGLQYWRGITDALKANGIEVITTHVPASGSIEARAAKLSDGIYEKAGGKSVNIVACVVTSLRCVLAPKDFANIPLDIVWYVLKRQIHAESHAYHIQGYAINFYTECLRHHTV